MSVDLPAPFSPSSACTSPSRRSRSIASLAMNAPNRFVIPRSSSARSALEPAGPVAEDGSSATTT